MTLDDHLCRIVPHLDGYAVLVPDDRGNVCVILDPEENPLTLMEAELVAALVEKHCQRTLAQWN